MPILDCFIRRSSVNDSPPWKNIFKIGGRLTSALIWNTFLITLFYLYLFRKYKIMLAFIPYIVIVGIGSFINDGMISNNLGRNIINIRKAGYNDNNILLFAMFNLLMSQIIAYIIIVYIIQQSPTLQETIHLYQTPTFVLKIICNLLITELCFTYGHSLMHTNKYLIKYHILHHCAIYSSWSTSLLFHPIDLILEFATPACSTVFMHYYVWNTDNDAVLLHTFLLFQLWYAYEHDENLNLYHVKHHNLCDSLYVIYTNIKGNPKYNILKHFMQKQDLLLTTTKAKTSKEL